MNKLYEKKGLDKMYYSMIVLVIVLNFLQSNKVMTLNSQYMRVFNTLAMISVLMLLDRDFFLPFLGDAVFPSGVLSNVIPAGADTKVCVKVPPNTKVVFWAAEGNESTDIMPWTAYKKYNNSGVAVSDASGNVCLNVRKPSGYKKPYMGGKLKPHVHYRYAISGGMFSTIKTAYL